MVAEESSETQRRCPHHHGFAGRRYQPSLNGTLFCFGRKATNSTGDALSGRLAGSPMRLERSPKLPPLVAMVGIGERRRLARLARWLQATRSIGGCASALAPVAALAVELARRVIDGDGLTADC